ncbi:MAG: tryptophan 7-halogenase [Verrucomicrobia bacterium]|nr:tryptophan 7-halogenase [Verrucomicrobiota bacterium]
MNRVEECDAVIIGGGPAGASAACVLAEHGRRVVVLEREQFPRYHIGESMIPFTYPALERIGLLPRLRESGFVKKYSVQFVSPSGRASQPFYFFNRYDRETVAQSWQVLRSEFDQMLLDHARSRGAEVRERHEVVEFLKEGNRHVGVRVRTPSGDLADWRAPMTLDASGREAIAATRNAWRRGDPRLNKVAVWTYYEGSRRDTGIDEGQTTVAYIPNKGWFWHIPLHQDRVSVGVVAEGKYLTRGGIKDPRAIFEREIPENRWIAERLSTGRCLGDYWLTAEYTFRSQYSAADGLVLAGDAYGFLDPVFSSGMMLALKSGVAAGDAIHAALQAGDCRAERFTGYSQMMHEGIENMRKLVYAFYDPQVTFRNVTDRWPELAGDLTDCLSGDVNKDFSRLFAAFGEFMTLPETLPYGFPRSAGHPEPVTT